MKTMKTKKTAPKTETTTAPKANAPTVRAIMYRISTLTAAAARHVTNNDKADRAEVFGYALRAIEETAAQYWKHHAKQEARA